MAGNAILPADSLIEAFDDALHAKLQADEFECLMLNTKNVRPSGVYLDLIDLGMRDWDDEPSALRQLKASRALERLQRFYPDIWEQVAMSAEIDVDA